MPLGVENLVDCLMTNATDNSVEVASVQVPDLDDTNGNPEDSRFQPDRLRQFHVLQQPDPPAQASG